MCIYQICLDGVGREREREREVYGSVSRVGGARGEEGLIVDVGLE